ncbi:HK97 family phage prohead protease [Tunturiibacter gelidiferens]|uniref:HK97 family phage prohead protease n=1 Tax=Tunturiibacter gelidiferens TaxID=3069689 RepID=UPI003D9B7562
MNKREVRQIKARELRVATNDKSQRVLSGYSSVFNSLSLDMGGWFELVSSSTFTRTLQESPDVLCLYSHDTSLVLGRTKSSTLTLTIDQTGLRFECILPDTTTANDLVVSIERGDVDGCSFGFVCQNDVWNEDNEGRVVRTLLDVDLYEVTITAAPAYPDTSVSLRSAPKEIRSRINETRDEGCTCGCQECKDGDCVNCSDTACSDSNCEHRDDDDVEMGSRDWKETMELRLKLASLRMK